MKTSLPSGRTQPRFSGIPTFLRFPREQDVPAAARPLDWLLYGIPFDAGVTYRPGARFGPRAVRDASQYIKPYHSELAVNIAENLSCADAGDAPVAPYSCRDNATLVRDHALTLGTPDHTRLLAVGGDHSVAYANIAATWQRLGSPKGGLGLIHLDAHLDTVDEVWGEQWGHASPFRRLIEDGIVNPARMISIGLRGTLNTPDDLAFARSAGVTLIPMSHWHATGPATLRDFLARSPSQDFYITFDVDAVDPAFAPGTGTPVTGGFTSAEILALFRSLKGIRLLGADIVEVLPDRDTSGITAMLAAQSLSEFLALDALSR
jgi:agmatinase